MTSSDQKQPDQTPQPQQPPRPTAEVLSEAHAQQVEAASAQVSRSVGQPKERVEGRLKVLGQATYAYEHSVENPVYLYPLISSIAKGKVRAIHDEQARALSGVLEVMTHQNAPKLLLKTDPELYILQGPEVQHKGQYIGAVIATSPEIARHAASLVRVEYDTEDHDAQFVPEHPKRYDPKKINTGVESDTLQGDPEQALSEAHATLDAVYTTPYEYHSPLEMHSMIATWSREKLDGVLGILGERPHLSIYDASQGVSMAQRILAPLWGLLPAQIEIISPYVGGAFGSKGVPHAPLMLVTLAARMLPGRPVKYMLSRQQMFRSVGYRLTTSQRVRLGAAQDGALSAITHDVTQSTAEFKVFAEQTALATRSMYASPNRQTTHRMVPLDIAPATFMRAPGEFPGMFALETALDELAHSLNIDPIALRLRNEPPTDPQDGKPFSSRHLQECLQEGAKLFGWDKRRPAGEHQEGEWQHGMGVASATYPFQKALPASASVTFEGGKYHVGIAAADLGTGAWTVLQQIAADALRVPEQEIVLHMGQTGLPFAYLAGGSTGTYNWGNAIMVAAVKFRDQYGEQPAEGSSATGSVHFPKDADQYSRHAYGAHFAAVKVSRVTGEVRVTRMLGIYDAGKIMNPSTARSQFIGGMTMGLSAALHEEGYLDSRFGSIANNDLAGYHFAAHADVPDIETHWLEYPDATFGPTGAKGIGEIGIVGTPAAIGNAIFNATGRRLRSLPFTADQLL